jgi:hypothetical protein
MRECASWISPAVNGHGQARGQLSHTAHNGKGASPASRGPAPASSFGRWLAVNTRSGCALALTFWDL